jgi:hypothetical protein
MKPTLTKQTTHELSKYAREINELEAEIQQRKIKIVGDVREFDCRIIEIGQKLIQAKLRCVPGTWLEWLKGHCTLSERSAQVYMRLASNPQRAAGAGSIRQALALLTEGEEAPSEAKPEREIPAYLMALDRVSKLCGYLQRQRPKDAPELLGWMPEEGRQKLREDLEPVARELWPGRIG